MKRNVTTFFISCIKWILYLLKRLGRGILELFWFKPATAPEVPPAQETTASGLDNDDPYNDYHTEVSSLDDVVVKMGLHKRISASHKYMYEMGRRDGSLGVSLHNLVDLARATAQEVFRHIYITLKGSLAALLAEKDTRQHIMDYDNLCHQRDQAYYDYVQYQYRFFPRSYSWFLFGFYLVVGLVLIIADIPLALRLIQLGFGMEAATDPQNQISNLFNGNFWHIVALNWETITMAIGIAFCSVYIKIYYDDFIGTPYANKTMTFRRFVQENNFADTMMEDEALHADIKSEYKTKRRWKTMLALFTLLVILGLAFFRLQTALAEELFTPTFYSTVAFVGITVLFPIIGGVCLSHSLTNFQNMLRLGKAAKKCGQSRKKYLQSVELYTMAQKKYEDLYAASQRLCDEERMVAEHLDCLLAFYRRGFSTGGMQPEKYIKGEDFYEKVREWRNIAISRKINHHISKLN